MNAFQSLSSVVCVAIAAMSQMTTFSQAQTVPQTSNAQSSPLVRFINPPELSVSARYSHVAEVTGGRLVFISGQVAYDKSGTLVGKGDFRAQAVQVYENLKACLKAVGADFSHIIKTTTFIVNMDGNIRTFREVRDQYFRGLSQPPASTAVGTTGLVDPELLLEIEAVALIPDKPVQTKK
jgi:enamine deaminase RidA (YjgF/YER057c/UK114 family)